MDSLLYKMQGEGGSKVFKNFGRYLWMVTTEDVEAAVALAEAFKEQIGVGVAADPVRARGGEEG